MNTEDKKDITQLEIDPEKGLAFADKKEDKSTFKGFNAVNIVGGRSNIGGIGDYKRDQDLNLQRLAAFGYLEQQRASLQTAPELVKNATGQFINTSLIGSIENFGYMLDFEEEAKLLQEDSMAERDFDNSMSFAARKAKEYVNEEWFPIYKTDIAKHGTFSQKLGDRTWWASQGEMAGTTISMIAPAAAAGIVGTVVTGNPTAGATVAGLASAKMEAAMEASGQYRDAYERWSNSEDLIKEVSGRYKNELETIDKKIQEIKGSLLNPAASENYETDLDNQNATLADLQNKKASMYKDFENELEKEARLRAGQEATYVYKVNAAKAPLEVAQYIALGGSFSKLNKALDATKATKGFKMANLAFQPASEAGEELFQGFGSQEAQRAVETGETFMGSGSRKRFGEYVISEEGKEAAFLGAAMGIIFEHAGKPITSIYRNIKNKANVDGKIPLTQEEFNAKSNIVNAAMLSNGFINGNSIKNNGGQEFLSQSLKLAEEQAGKILNDEKSTEEDKKAAQESLDSMRKNAEFISKRDEELAKDDRFQDSGLRSKYVQAELMDKVFEDDAKAMQSYLDDRINDSGLSAEEADYYIKKQSIENLKSLKSKFKKNSDFSKTEKESAIKNIDDRIDKLNEEIKDSDVKNKKLSPRGAQEISRYNENRLSSEITREVKTKPDLDSFSNMTKEKANEIIEKSNKENSIEFSKNAKPLITGAKDEIELDGNYSIIKQKNPQAAELLKKDYDDKKASLKYEKDKADIEKKRLNIFNSLSEKIESSESLEELNKFDHFNDLGLDQDQVNGLEKLLVKSKIKKGDKNTSSKYSEIAERELITEESYDEFYSNLESRISELDNVENNARNYLKKKDLSSEEKSSLGDILKQVSRKRKFLEDQVFSREESYEPNFATDESNEENVDRKSELESSFDKFAVQSSVNQNEFFINGNSYFLTSELLSEILKRDKDGNIVGIFLEDINGNKTYFSNEKIVDDLAYAILLTRAVEIESNEITQVNESVLNEVKDLSLNEDNDIDFLFNAYLEINNAISKLKSYADKIKKGYLDIGYSKSDYQQDSEFKKTNEEIAALKSKKQNIKNRLNKARKLNKNKEPLINDNLKSNKIIENESETKTSIEEKVDSRNERHADKGEDKISGQKTEEAGLKLVTATTIKGKPISGELSYSKSGEPMVKEDGKKYSIKVDPNSINEITQEEPTEVNVEKDEVSLEERLTNSEKSIIANSPKPTIDNNDGIGDSDVIPNDDTDGNSSLIVTSPNVVSVTKALEGDYIGGKWVTKHDSNGNPVFIESYDASENNPEVFKEGSEIILIVDSEFIKYKNGKPMVMVYRNGKPELTPATPENIPIAITTQGNIDKGLKNFRFIKDLSNPKYSNINPDAKKKTLDMRNKIFNEFLKNKNVKFISTVTSKDGGFAVKSKDYNTIKNNLKEGESYPDDIYIAFPTASGTIITKDGNVAPNEKLEPGSPYLMVKNSIGQFVGKYLKSPIMSKNFDLYKKNVNITFAIFEDYLRGSDLFKEKGSFYAEVGKYFNLREDIDESKKDYVSKTNKGKANNHLFSAYKNEDSLFIALPNKKGYSIVEFMKRNGGIMYIEYSNGKQKAISREAMMNKFMDRLDQMKQNVKKTDGANPHSFSRLILNDSGVLERINEHYFDFLSESGVLTRVSSVKGSDGKTYFSVAPNIEIDNNIKKEEEAVLFASKAPISKDNSLSETKEDSRGEVIERKEPNNISQVDDATERIEEEDAEFDDVDFMPMENYDDYLKKELDKVEYRNDENKPCGVSIKGSKWKKV